VGPVRGSIVLVRDDTVVLEVSEVLAGEVAERRVEVWLGSWRFEVGDSGLFAITAPDRLRPHVQWIGHGPDGTILVIDEHQTPIVGEAAQADYIRGRASWDRANPAPDGAVGFRVEPSEALYDALFAHGVRSTSGPSGVIVPPDPEFVGNPEARPISP
jgi:hypothetical protein